MARALALNEDLVEAIGLGHDLGHPPFGHVGEEALDRCLSERFGLRFRHHEHSLRVVDTLERDGAGLNLTEPVRDGIVSHSWPGAEPATLEGKIVRLDRPRRLHQPRHRRRAARRGAVGDVTCPRGRSRSSATPARAGSTRSSTTSSSTPTQQGDIVQGDSVGGAMSELRAFMFERVYLGPEATREHAKISGVVRSLFDHYCAHPEEIPTSIPAGDLARRVTDYLAGMTDRYCIRTFEALTVPVAFAP